MPLLEITIFHMAESENNLEKKLSHIARQLGQLDTKLQKQLSFKRNFLLSVVSGVGYAIGATIIAGIVIAILSWSISSIQDVPILNKIFTASDIQQTLHDVETID